MSHNSDEGAALCCPKNFRDVRNLSVLPTMPQAGISNPFAKTLPVLDARAATQPDCQSSSRRRTRLLGRLMMNARCWARRSLRSVEEKRWSSTPLTLDKVGGILSAWDARAVAHRRLASESHQVFHVTFRGESCVAKFAGREFSWKFVLQDEVARIQKAASAGLPAPPVLLARVGRLRHPFFIMPFLAARPKATWTDAVRRNAWVEEAALIKRLPDAVLRARLPVKTEAQSVAQLEREIADTRLQLVMAGLPRDPYFDVLDRFTRVIRSKPWVIGQYQPPELVHDGQRFWAIDWDAFSYTHPLKWVNDFSFYDIVRDPKIGEEHLSYLLRELGFEPSDVTTQKELKLWQQFKAISVGSYVIQKDKRWEYFEVLKQRFFAVASALCCLLSATYSVFDLV